MLKAIVFDFDGTLVDTESPSYLTWQETYRAHGTELSMADWSRAVGTSHAFDPARHLERAIGGPVPLSVFTERQRRRDELVAKEGLRPGVPSLLKEAKTRGLALGVASSSSLAWVNAHLKRTGISDAFQVIVGRDDVSRVKPDPELYLLAVERLGVAPSEAIAIEDSPNGAMAALAAGLLTVVVPNAITREFLFPEGVHRLAALSDLSLDESPFSF